MKSDPNRRVIDYGCGSGILGLTARAFGASEVVGVDIELDSLVSAQRNCEENGLGMELLLAKDVDGVDLDPAIESYQKVQSTLLTGAAAPHSFQPASTLADRQFDLVVANILAPILIALADELFTLCAPGGKVALSGVISKQADTVLNRFEELFDNVRIQDEEDGWVLITAEKL